MKGWIEDRRGKVWWALLMVSLCDDVFFVSYFMPRNLLDKKKVVKEKELTEKFVESNEKSFNEWKDKKMRGQMKERKFGRKLYLSVRW